MATPAASGAGRELAAAQVCPDTLSISRAALSLSQAKNACLSPRYQTVFLVPLGGPEMQRLQPPGTFTLETAVQEVGEEVW